MPWCAYCRQEYYSATCSVGTEEERGLKLWRENLQQSTNVNESEASSYDLPFGMAVIRKSRWGHRLPVSPTFSIGQSDTAGQPDGQTKKPDNMTPIPEEGGIDNVTFNDFNSVDTQM